MEKRLLTIREASQYLNVSESFLYKRVEAKEIPHIRFCRKILFDLKKLDRYIEENSVKVEDWSKILDL